MVKFLEDFGYVLGLNMLKYLLSESGGCMFEQLMGAGRLNVGDSSCPSGSQAAG